MKDLLLRILLWLRVPVLSIAATKHSRGYVTVILWETPKLLREDAR